MRSLKALLKIVAVQCLLVVLQSVISSVECNTDSIAASQGGGPVIQVTGRRRFSSLLREVRDANPVSVHPKAAQRRKRGAQRNGVVRKQRAPADARHRVVLRTEPRNRELLKRHLEEVSYPSSPLYGKHWSHSAVRELIAPDPASVAHVEGFLRQHGLEVVEKTRDGDFITAEGPIGSWEQLLETQFFEWHYEHEPDHTFLRAEEYAIPPPLVAHVAAMFRTVQMPDRNFLRRRAEVLAMHAPAAKSETLLRRHLRNTASSNHSRALTGSTGSYTTPALINQFYHISSNRGSKSFASHAVWESIDQAYSPSDLKKFQQHFDLPEEAVDHVIGGHESNSACRKDNGNDCIEANLDIQYLMAIAQHTETTYFYWDDDDFLLSWAQDVLDMSKPPLIFSISYGLDEAYLDRDYADAFDVAAMQLGLMGVTIFASAGDDGAVSPNARSSSLSCGYSPSFPASSPYVTAVGGTMVSCMLNALNASYIYDDVVSCGCCVVTPLRVRGITDLIRRRGRRVAVRRWPARATVGASSPAEGGFRRCTAAPTGRASTSSTTSVA